MDGTGAGAGGVSAAHRAEPNGQVARPRGAGKSNPATARGALDWDAIVVGGGPSGSAFAISAARAGMSVALFEAAPGPRHKVCGELVTEDAARQLSLLGIDLRPTGAPSKDRLSLVAGGARAESPLPMSAVGLSRRTLDELLIERALEVGVEVVRGAKVARLDPEDRGALGVVLQNGARYRSAFAALATGSLSLRGVPGRLTGDTVGMKMRLSLSPAAQRDLAGRVQVMGYDGGYQGALLVEDGLASLAWIMPAARVKSLGIDWSAQAAFLSRQSEIVGDMISGAKASWQRPLTVSGLQYGYLRRSPVSEGAFPVGRQMAIIPSIAGDGIAIALYTGIKAATAASQGQSPSRYQAAIRRDLGRQFFFARAAHRVCRNAFLMSATVGLARRAPWILSSMTRATRLQSAS